MSTLAFLPGLLLAIASAVVPAAEQTPLRVFLLAGQSNMAGLAQVADLPEELKAPQPEVLIFTRGSFEPLEPGKGQEQEGRFGPEVTFGQAMAKHLRAPVGLIKVAVGGSSLAKSWNPAGNGSFGRLVKLASEARKSRPIAIVGMIWLQGAGDAKDEAMAQAYKANFEAFIAAVRKEFGEQLPFVYGRSNAMQSRYPFAEVVRAAQDGIRLPKCRIIGVEGVGLGQDELHYNAAGQVELGRRFAAAMIEQLL